MRSRSHLGQRDGVIKADRFDREPVTQNATKIEPDLPSWLGQSRLWRVLIGANRISASGTFRIWSDVQFEPVMRSRADIIACNGLATPPTVPTPEKAPETCDCN